MTASELLSMLRSMYANGEVVVMVDGYAYEVVDVEEDTDGTILVRVND